MHVSPSEYGHITISLLMGLDWDDLYHFMTARRQVWIQWIFHVDVKYWACFTRPPGIYIHLFLEHSEVWGPRHTSGWRDTDLLSDVQGHSSEENTKRITFLIKFQLPTELWTETQTLRHSHRLVDTHTSYLLSKICLLNVITINNKLSDVSNISDLTTNRVPLGYKEPH